MKTITYRAATMREALEKVKEDLGEDALVVDSRRVRAGGLMGFGAADMIEVRVAAREPERQPESGGSAPARRKSFLTSLSLTPAVRPATEERQEQREQSQPAARPAGRTLTAVSARAYAETAGEEIIEHNARFEAEPPAVETAEVAETAPRVVHRRPAQPAPQGQSKKPAEQQPAGPRVERHEGELEKLRAELREMKFALSAFSSRAQAAAFNPSATAAGACDEIYDSPFYEAYIELAATGLAPELARRSVRASLAVRGRARLTAPELAREALGDSLAEWVGFGDDPVEELYASGGEVKAVALVGPTGVGKTTTLAKLAARVALRERKRVELITLDTYRIAAVEQLRTYAEIIGAGFHVPRNVLELDALVRRLSGEAAVLIDTTGRSPNDLADQMELADYLRASDSILKCLVLQATTHPADAAVVAGKFALYGADRLVITKLDETSQPGSSVQIARDARLPLAYLCAGQRVPEDIERASPASFGARVLGPALAAAAAA